MVRVYGMSDDLVEIEGAEYPYEVEEEGSANNELFVCENEDDDICSDIFDIDANFLRCEVIHK